MMCAPVVCNVWCPWEAPIVLEGTGNRRSASKRDRQTKTPRSKTEDGAGRAGDPGVPARGAVLSPSCSARERRHGLMLRKT